jgi:hypothetical protein
VWLVKCPNRFFPLRHSAKSSTFSHQNRPISLRKMVKVLFGTARSRSTIRLQFAEMKRFSKSYMCSSGSGPERPKFMGMFPNWDRFALIASEVCQQQKLRESKRQVWNGRDHAVRLWLGGQRMRYRAGRADCLRNLGFDGSIPLIS